MNQSPSKEIIFHKSAIRPGQRVPYRKGTQREIDERRGYVVRLLARRVPKMLIHSVIKHQFTREWRTVDRDIAFVTGLANIWLTRTRGRCRQTCIPEVLANLKLIPGSK